MGKKEFKKKDDKDRQGRKEQGKERKRKKEEEKKKLEQQAKKAKKKVDDSSEEDVSSDGSEKRKFSIFDEPVLDLNNPIYFSMYDKVKARRSCVKAREEEEARKQQEALDKFSKLKAQRLKREEKKAHA